MFRRGGGVTRGGIGKGKQILPFVPFWSPIAKQTVGQEREWGAWPGLWKCPGGAREALVSLPVCSRELRSHVPVQVDTLAGPKSQEGPNRAPCCHGNPDLKKYFRKTKYFQYFVR